MQINVIISNNLVLCLKYLFVFISVSKRQFDGLTNTAEKINNVNFDGNKGSGQNTNVANNGGLSIGFLYLIFIFFS